MTDVGRMSVGELVGKVLADEHADVLRQAVAWLAQQLMEAEVTAAAGAGYGQRSPDRAARRNGYRERAWDTRVGSIELAIPRLRQGSYIPSFLEPRRRSEQALVAVVQEAYVNGVSTRKVDRLVEALGLAGVSKDTVSPLCRGLDEQVTAFRERPLEGAYPYLWLDAKVEKVRAGGRVEHRALVIFIDLVEGTDTEIGLLFRVFLPDGGTVIADVGRLVFDAEGNLIFEAGPHPALHGDFAALCAALS